MGDNLINRIKLIEEFDVYNRPQVCTECGGVMVFKGCGEYRCEKCKHVAYDDYGKVRNYIEQHRGANTAEAAEATGVKQKTIRTMLRESRLEITEGSSTYLKCEVCGTNIRSGRVCSKCEVEFNRRMENKLREKHNKMMAGFGAGRIDGDEGSKRFTREK